MVEVEGEKSGWHRQKCGIRQGPLSPFLFILIMNRIFEQVGVLKEAYCQKFFGESFEPVRMQGLSFNEILFADDTLIFGEPGRSLDAFLWAIESVSCAYGLKLNRSKCAHLSLWQSAPKVEFSSGTAVSREARSDYLGSMMNISVAPKAEVNRRLALARYTWLTLRNFWREGLLSVKDRLLIYQALIESKLTYGLHVLPLKDELLNKMNAFQMRGIRQLLKIAPTHVDRNNSNKKVLELAEERINTNKEGEPESPNRKTIKLISEVLLKRAQCELGEIIRLPEDDPRKEVTFKSGLHQLNIPETNRVGKPKTQWAIETMKRIWKEKELGQRCEQHPDVHFDYKNDCHLSIIYQAGVDGEF
jgi:hypothetical protein